MVRIILAAAVFWAAGTGGSSGAGDTVAGRLWQKRILIVFADEADPRLAEQRKALLGDEPGLAERDLIAFAVVGDGLQPIHGPVPSGDSAGDLRRRFEVSPSGAFTAVLIGKDGGVKWRADRPVPKDQLFAVIDAMPMRRLGR